MDYSNMSKEDLIRANQELLARLERLPGSPHSDYKIRTASPVHTSSNDEWSELFCRISANFTLTFFSKAFLDFFNIKSQGFVGKNLLLLLKEEYRDKVRYTLQRLKPANPVALFEHTEIYADREIRWLRWQVTAVFDENDVFIEYHAFCQDITESKEAWEQLQHRLNIEHVLIQAFKFLVGSEAVDFDVVMEMVGKAFRVNHAYIYEFRDHGSAVEKSWNWSDGHICSADKIFAKLDRNIFTWSLRQLQENKYISIANRNQLPPEARNEKRFLEQQGIFATVVVPVFGCDNELQACIGFNDTEKCRQWKEDDMKSLELFAEMLASYQERQRMEKALRTAEAPFRALADTVPAAIYVYSQSDSDTPLRYLNSSYPEITGYLKNELLNENWWNIIHPDYREMAKARAWSRLHGETCPIRYEMKMLSKGGDVFWVDMSAQIIEWEGETAVLGIIFNISNQKRLEDELRQARDEMENRVIDRTIELIKVNDKLRQEIAERRLVERELQRSEANFRTLAETSPALIYVSQDDKFLYTNATCTARMGYSREQLAAMNTWDLLRPDYKEVVRKNNLARQNGAQIPAYEVVIRNRAGNDIWGYIYADIIEYEGQQANLVMIVDITERKKMEEDLLQASKLESLGILAGGIAHDFNNILTVISGNISLAQMIKKPDDEVCELLTEVEQAVWQACDLTQQLLTFSKGGAPIKETASIQDLLRETASFVLRGSNVSCFYSIPDDLWPVSVDKGQICQVINNIIINADQAMPEGGLIILQAENRCSVPGVALPAGNYVKISIIDAGIGISLPNLPKIFDPYFSTKTRGHGLGLASCYSIIKKHDGHIKVISEVGAGTTVNIYLPAFPEQMVDTRQLPEIPLSGQGKILIMDDEAIVRGILSKMLKNLGYTYGVAADGQQALLLYKQGRQANQPYDAVIMDLTIAGGMGGKETVRKILEIDPEAKVIVSSGYSNDPVMADFKHYGFCGVLPKPYQIQAVNQILYEILTLELEMQVGR